MASGHDFISLNFYFSILHSAFCIRLTLRLGAFVAEHCSFLLFVYNFFTKNCASLSVNGLPQKN